MDDRRLERIEKKMDDTSEHMKAIDLTLGAQHLSLVAHMKRTDVLEAEFLPIRKKIFMLEGIVRFLGLLATIAAIVEVFKLYR